MTFDNHTRFQLDPHSRFRAFDDSEGVLLMQEAAEVLVTNATGSRVVELIRTEIEFEQIVETIAQEFDVPQAQARSDVEQFTEQLLDAGAIRTHAPV